MAQPPKKTRRSAAPTDVIRLLGALAARGRFVRAGEDAPAVTVTVFDAAGRAAVTGTASALATARQRGWVGPIGADGCLALTAAGREVLRRSLSTLAALRAEAAGPGSRSGEAPATPASNPKESPLTWLASRSDAAGRPMLSAAQVAAGERLRADLHFARLTPRVTMGWSGLPPVQDRGAAAAGLGGDLADTVVAARTRVTAALKAVGPEFADILIDVCGHLRGLEEIAKAEGWPRRATRLILQRALAALARHYGLEPEVGVELMIARRLRHWGAQDYRPTLKQRS